MGYPLDVLQFGDEQARAAWHPGHPGALAGGGWRHAGYCRGGGLQRDHRFCRTGHSASVPPAGVADYRKLLPASMLGGAILLILADVIARVIIAPQQLPVGIVTAMLGAPFFLWVLKRAKAQAFW